MKKAINPVVATSLLLIIVVSIVVFVNIIYDDYDYDYPKEFYNITDLNEIPVEIYHYVKEYDYNCYAIQEASYLKPQVCCDKFGEPVIKYDYRKDKYLVIMNETSCKK